MEGLKMIPYIVMVIAISGIIAGASMLVNNKFADTVKQCAEGNYTGDDNIGNVSTSFCTNSTEVYLATGVGTDGLNLSEEYYVLLQSGEGISTVSEQFPTVGIIAVLVIIISLLAGVFAYMRYFG